MGNKLRAFNCCANPTISNETSKADPDIEETLSSDYLWASDYLWEQVYLSHSAKQRDFVEQLYIDLTRANISCFFDRYSISEDQRIKTPNSFEAAKKCEIAIVVLSEDYITSKLSMLQLCAFVEAEKTVSSKLKIYPLFYEMSPDEFSKKIDDLEEKRYPESWSDFANHSQSSIDFDACLEALKALLSFNKPLYVQNDGTVNYRHKLLCDVYGLLSSNMKGKERLWQEVADLFEKAPYYRNCVKVIGLHGIDGSGKSTLCKILCGFYSDRFEGKVFHAEFQEEGLPVETLKGMLQILTYANEESMKLVGNYEQALSLLKQQMSSQRVFLCLDNIPDRLKSVKEAQAILTAGFGEGSLVVLTARSGEILERVIPEEEKRSFERVPNLTEEEAIDVLLNFTNVEAHERVQNLTEEEAIDVKQIAAGYADLCHFGNGMSRTDGSYHPLALTILGAFLCEKYACHPSEWPPPSHFHQYASQYDAQKMIFYILEKTFNVLHPQSLRMLLLLIFYVPNFDFVQNFHHSTFQWLVDACSVSNKFVHDAIYGMKNRGLIERRGRNSIAFHDLLVEFGKGKLEEMEKWLSVEGMDKFPNVTPSIVELLKLDHYTRKCTIPFNELSNVSVVHLERVRNQEILNFESMIAVRSITIVDCVDLEEIRGLGSLANLRFLKVEGCTLLVRCPQICLNKLRHIEMQLPPHLHIVDGLSSLSKANLSLEEIYLDGNCREVLFSRFRRIRALSINNSHRIGPLDFKDCRELQWIKLWNCKATNGLNLTGCINVRSIYVHMNDCITEIVGLEGLIALEELHLIKMNKVKQLPSFQRLVNLRYLTLRDMANLKELPDLSNCHLLTTDRIDTNIGENEVTSRNV